MVAINVIALALALCGPALAEGHHHHRPNGTGSYYPGHPIKFPGHPTGLPIYPSHGHGGHHGQTTLTSRYRSSTALPSGPRTSTVDDANTFERTSTRVPGVIYPTGTGGFCGNCTYGNATIYAFAARSAVPVEVIHDGKDEPSHVAQEKHGEHGEHGGHEEQGPFEHHVTGQPKILPTETPIFKGTEDYDHKMPEGFAHMSTFMKRGRDTARATAAPAAGEY